MLHAVGLKLGKIVGTLQSTGKAIVIDSSARDLHLSTKLTDATKIYSKLKAPESQYFGVALSDVVLAEFLQEFHQRRNEINVLEVMSLFPDFDRIREDMKMETIKHLMPESVSKYGSNAKLSVRLNP